VKTRERKRKRRIRKRAALRYILRLYITGQTARSLRSIENLRHLCEKYLKDQFGLEVIDIYRQPAAEGQFIAAPTLIKTMPLPLPAGGRFFRSGPRRFGAGSEDHVGAGHEEASNSAEEK